MIGITNRQTEIVDRQIDGWVDGQKDNRQVVGGEMERHKEMKLDVTQLELVSA